MTGGLLPISSPWRQAPWESWPAIFLFQLYHCGHSPYVTSPLTTGWVCHLQLLLALTSTVILRDLWPYLTEIRDPEPESGSISFSVFMWINFTTTVHIQKQHKRDPYASKKVSGTVTGWGHEVCINNFIYLTTQYTAWTMHHWNTDWTEWIPLIFVETTLKC